MGFIYIIKNNKNDKVYIGMTTRTIEDRMKEHKKTYNDIKNRSYNFKLYKAMREIGFENFYAEEIEQIEDSRLDIREKYWIDYYDSIYNGYNTALGGYGKSLITKSKEHAMKILYDNGWLLKDIARVIDVNSSDIGEILRKTFNVDTTINSNKSFSKEISGIDSFGNIKNFNSISDAGRYCIDNNLLTTKNLSSVISKISMVLDKDNRTAYGHTWKTTWKLMGHGEEV